MNIVAIQTARAGSKTVTNKNKINIEGKPLFLINTQYALASKKINSVYVSTDDLDIKTTCSMHQINYIDRPSYLCQDNSSHYEAILHSYKLIEQRENKPIDLLIVLLGNNRHAYTDDIDSAIDILDSTKDADSIISVSRYNMFHPYRSYKSESSYLTTHVQQDIIYDSIKDNLHPNDKNAFTDAYFFNGSFWIIKANVFLRNNGLLPFTWLGNKILPYYQSEGIMELDAPWQTINLMS